MAVQKVTVIGVAFTLATSEFSFPHTGNYGTWFIIALVI